MMMVTMVINGGSDNFGYLLEMIRLMNFNEIAMLYTIHDNKLLI